MLDAVTSALSGLSAATRRIDPVASNSFNDETRGVGDPSPSVPAGGPQPASGGLGSAPPEDPRAVEETSSANRGETASLGSTTPSYLSVFDPSVGESDDEGSAVIKVAVESGDADQANPDGLDGSDSGVAAESRARSEADQQAIRVTNDLVRRLYDLG